MQCVPSWQMSSRFGRSDAEGQPMLKQVHSARLHGVDERSQAQRSTATLQVRPQRDQLAVTHFRKDAGASSVPKPLLARLCHWFHDCRSSMAIRSQPWRVVSGSCVVRPVTNATLTRWSDPHEWPNKLNQAVSRQPGQHSSPYRSQPPGGNWPRTNGGRSLQSARTTLPLA